MQKANVVGVGIGFAETAGTKTDEICEGVRVDVQNVGELKTLK